MSPIALVPPDRTRRSHASLTSGDGCGPRAQRSSRNTSSTRARSTHVVASTGAALGETSRVARPTRSSRPTIDSPTSATTGPNRRVGAERGEARLDVRGGAGAVDDGVAAVRPVDQAGGMLAGHVQVDDERRDDTGRDDELAARGRGLGGALVAVCQQRTQPRIRTQRHARRARLQRRPATRRRQPFERRARSVVIARSTSSPDVRRGPTSSTVEAVGRVTRAIPGDVDQAKAAPDCAAVRARSVTADPRVAVLRRD